MYLFETKKFKSNILNTYLDYINSFISYSKSEADFQLMTYSATACYTHLDYIKTYPQFQTYSNKIDNLAAVGSGRRRHWWRWRGGGTTVREDGHARWQRRGAGIVREDSHARWWRGAGVVGGGRPRAVAEEGHRRLRGDHVWWRRRDDTWADEGAGQAGRRANEGSGQEGAWAGEGGGRQHARPTASGRRR
jgi:hypothetical protein